MALLCIFAGAVPVQAQAYETKGEYRIHTLAQKKWLTAPEDGENYTNVYKIKVPSDGYIKVSVNSDKVTGRHANRVPAMLFTSYKVNADNAMDDYHVANFQPGTHFLALKKGTYYFYPGADNLKFKWEHHAVSHGSNYCMAKAETLASGKNRKVSFAYGYEFAKWYKVNLAKKQKIRLYARRLESKARYGRVYGPGIQAIIVNKYGKKIKTTEIDTNTQITGLLAKGTYYICLTRLRPDGKDEYYGDRLISLTMKKQ